ncbi:MAG: hypothetical protein ACUVUC_06650 [Thermoguttaceae bacterium]
MWQFLEDSAQPVVADLAVAAAAVDRQVESLRATWESVRAGWERGGGSRLIHVQPDWYDSYVVIWAVVDLGFQVFASRGLVLGRLRDASGGTAGGWRARLFRPRRRQARAPAVCRAEGLAPGADKGERG